MDKHLQCFALPGAECQRVRSRSGCFSCRTGKKKCDEVKPICGLCERLGRSCSFPASSTSKRRTQPRSSNDFLILQKSLRSALQCDLTLPRINYFVQRALWSRKSSKETSVIAAELEYAHGAHTLTWSCLDAMATMYWGSTRNDPAATTRGRQLKGACLQHIRDRIRAKQLSPDLVAAVSVLRLVETRFQSQASDWFVHARGLSSIIYAMGPTAFQCGAMRKIYEKNRWVIIAVSHIIRTKCIFDCTTWSVVPWIGTNKDMLQSLLDICVRTPAVHAAWDAGSPLAASAIRSMLHDLHAWRREADAVLKTSVSQWDDELPVDLPCPWASSLRFAEIDHAYAVILLNMVLIILCQYLSKFPVQDEIVHGPCVDSTVLLCGQLIPLGDAMARAHVAALEIASTTSWILHNSATGVLYLAGPIMAYMSLWQTKDEEKQLWASRVLDIAQLSCPEWFVGGRLAG